MTGPMISTWKRSHLVFDRNSSGRPSVRSLVLGALAGHLHVAAERQRADAVLRVAAAEADDRGIEAELELEHADAHALGGEKMTELVHEHEHAEHEGKRQKCRQTSNLRPSILTRGRSPAHARGPRDPPPAPRPAWPPGVG